MKEFREWLKQHAIVLNETQEHQFDRYFKSLVEGNQKANLTAIIDQKEVYIKHFLDSLCSVPKKWIESASALCDVGTGAGFPGIPLKIAYPGIELTLIEPTGKKVRFLESVVSDLGLEKVRIIGKRAEDIVNEYREHFDIVTARAVARLDVLSEICIPFVRIGGHFVCSKGAGYKEELEEAQKAIEKTGGVVTSVTEFDLPENHGKRALITISKIVKTNPVFPRSYAAIKKKPL